MARFEINGVIYEANDKGTYFYKSTGDMDKKGNPIMKRISRAIYEHAFEEYTKTAADEADAWEAEADAEIEERKAEQERKDAETEKSFNKETKKSEKKAPKKSRKTAFTFEQDGEILATLTEKQVKFIQRMPEDDFYEHGLESALWIEVYCDTIADEFNAMAVGAMVSTLREKHLIDVAVDKVNGRKCKFFVFTELGKQVAKELGLN